MFRYGGPIKEGVMSGIREPRANGGSMRNRALLVGNPAFPMQNGRALHSQNLQGIFNVAGQAAKKTATNISKKPLSVFSPGGKWKAIKNIGLTGIRPIQNWYRKWRSSLDMPPRGVDVGGKLGPGYAGVGQRPLSMLEKMKYFATKNPKTTIGGAYLGSGPAYNIATGEYPLLKKAGWQALDLAVPDFIFDQDKYFADKKAKEELEKKGPGTDKSIFETEKIIEPEKSDEEIRAERIQKYRDIMDIKGMNKRAAYDSLIDASKIIQESGDFKEDIKSGDLINKVIQATSKQFDKPAKTKDAIDTLILKGEIEADIASGKAGTYQKNIDAIASNLNISKEDAAKMILNKPLNLREQVTVDIGVSKQPLTHKSLVSSAKKQYPKAQVMLTQEEYDDVVGDDSTGEAFIKTTVTDKLSKDPNAKVAGVYIVGKEVVQVDGAGNTLTLFP
jgi:hypothetical protein